MYLDGLPQSLGITHISQWGVVDFPILITYIPVRLNIHYAPKVSYKIFNTLVTHYHQGTHRHPYNTPLLFSRPPLYALSHNVLGCCDVTITRRRAGSTTMTLCYICEALVRRVVG